MTLNNYITKLYESSSPLLQECLDSILNDRVHIDEMVEVSDIETFKENCKRRYNGSNNFPGSEDFMLNLEKLPINKIFIATITTKNASYLLYFENHQNIVGIIKSIYHNLEKRIHLNNEYKQQGIAVAGDFFYKGEKDYNM